MSAIEIALRIKMAEAEAVNNKMRLQLSKAVSLRKQAVEEGKMDKVEKLDDFIERQRRMIKEHRDDVYIKSGRRLILPLERIPRRKTASRRVTRKSTKSQYAKSRKTTKKVSSPKRKVSSLKRKAISPKRKRTTRK